MLLSLSGIAARMAHAVRTALRSAPNGNMRLHKRRRPALTYFVQTLERRVMLTAEAVIVPYEIDLGGGATWSVGVLQITDNPRDPSHNLKIDVVGGDISITDGGLPVAIKKDGAPYRASPGEIDAIRIKFTGGKDGTTIDLRAVTAANGFKLHDNINTLLFPAELEPGEAPPIVPDDLPPQVSIVTGAFNVALNPNAGKDIIYGSPDFENFIYSNTGNDKVYGGSKVDTILGGTGDDRLYGRAGDDFIYGFVDNPDERGFIRNENGDVIMDESDQDWISGGTGADTIEGGPDKNEIRGDEGNDFIYGGNADDKLYGGADNDNIRGGGGNDYIKGDAGNDFIDGGIGNDEIRGDKGADTIEGDAGTDQIWGGTEADHIYGGSGDDWIRGGDGNDWLGGGSDDDTIDGDGDDDTIQGGSGDDILFGSSGRDTISGFTGMDYLSGGLDQDTLWSNETAGDADQPYDDSTYGIKGKGDEDCDTEDGHPDADPNCGAAEAEIPLTLTIETPSINESEEAVISGTVTVPTGGITEPIKVDWGDGVVDLVVVDSQGNYSATHIYDDDIPVGTSSDIFEVRAYVACGCGNLSITGDLTVFNLDPALTVPSGQLPDWIFTGRSVSIFGSVSDPSAIDEEDLEVTIDWGDGMGFQAAERDENDFSAAYACTTPGTYTITVRVSDDDLGVDEWTASIEVIGVSTQVTGSGLTLEGSPYSISLIGTMPVDEWVIDWGDGELEAVSGGSASHTYRDDDPTSTPSDEYTIVVIPYFDGEAYETYGNHSVTVQNVAPEVSQLQLSSTSVYEGDTVTLASPIVDDAGEGDIPTLEFSIDWGDGTSAEELSAEDFEEHLTHRYTDSGMYVVTVTVSDDDTGTTTRTQSVTVNDFGVSLDGPGILYEGTPYTFTLTSSTSVDRWFIDWGDGGEAEVIQGTLSATHTYIDDNPSGSPSDAHTITYWGQRGDLYSDHFEKDVTVHNVDPEVSPLQFSSTSVFRGDTVVLTAPTVTDAGTDDIILHRYTINWGDGTSFSNLTAAQFAQHLSHQYTTTGMHTVTVTVTDDDTGSTTRSEMVTVNAVTVSLSGDSMTNEGSIYTLALTATASATEWEIDWGEGDDPEALSGNPSSKTHYYMDDDPTSTSSDVKTVRARAKYAGIWSDWATQSVTVTNVAPMMNQPVLSGSTIDVGQSVVVSGTFSDVGSYDTHTVRVDWGDQTHDDVTPNEFGYSKDHIYAVSGTYTVTVTITDDDNGVVTQTASITVNPPVSISASGSGTTMEGSNYDLYLNPTGSILQWEVDWGDGSGPTYGTGMSAMHQYMDDDPTATSSDVKTISVRAQRMNGTWTTPITQTVTVSNQSPTLYSVWAPSSAYVWDMISLTGSVSDPGMSDTFQASVNWGDGTTTNESVYGGWLSASHTYTMSGYFTISVTVYDDDLGMTTGSTSVMIQSFMPLLASQSGTGDSGEALTRDALTLLRDAAIARWVSIAGDFAAEALEGVTLVVTDLPARVLGLSTPSVVVLDSDAAGYGWFVDSTPDIDEEFVILADGEHHAISGGMADGRLDLLTVVMHEFGHVLGIDHDHGEDGDHSLMEEHLVDSVRRLPTEVQWVAHLSNADTDETEPNSGFGQAEESDDGSGNDGSFQTTGQFTNGTFVRQYRLLTEQESEYLLASNLSDDREVWFLPAESASDSQQSARWTALNAYFASAQFQEYLATGF